MIRTKWGGGGCYTIFRLKVQCMIWWWQLECNDALTPLLVTKIGWSVKVKSMQEELFLWICAGSFIIWWKPFGVLNKNFFSPSNGSLSLHHQKDDLVLKSPHMTENDGLQALMSYLRCPKFVKKLSIFLPFWLGER